MKCTRDLLFEVLDFSLMLLSKREAIGFSDTSTGDECVVLRDIAKGHPRLVGLMLRLLPLLACGLVT